jgi:Tol biopolymer transport system component
LLTTEGTERFDLWMLDVESGVHTRFTFGPEPALFPVWSPDGTTVYYGDVSGNMFTKSADGSSPATRILEIPNMAFWPHQVTPDGKELLFLVQVPDTGLDIRVMRLAGDPEPRPLVTAPGNQDSASLSPDGRWLAVATDESGRSEVVVVPYPSLSGRWQVSPQGGSAPEWLPDGRGIVYRAPDGRAMRVDVDGRGGSLVVGAATPIFGGQAVPGLATLAPDGKRLLVIVPQGRRAGMTLDLVTDWRRLLTAQDGQ